jgi:hypothetical protein
MKQSLAPALPIRAQAALSPAGEAWASRVAATLHRFGVKPRGARRMLAGEFPSECQAVVMAEMAAIAGAA